MFSGAGLIEEINPFNNKPGQQPLTNKDNNGKNNNNTQNNNNPLAPLQNLFGNASQLFNGSNPFGQLFPSQSGGNFLDNIKIFLVGTQGIVMPASSILGGFQNLLQGLGSIGNLMQVPSIPLGK